MYLTPKFGKGRGKKCELRKWENYEWWWWKSTKELQFAKSLRLFNGSSAHITFFTRFPRAQACSRWCAVTSIFIHFRIFNLSLTLARQFESKTCKVLIDSDTTTKRSSKKWAQKGENSRHPRINAQKLHSNEWNIKKSKFQSEMIQQKNSEWKSSLFSILTLPRTATSRTCYNVVKKNRKTALIEGEEQNWHIKVVTWYWNHLHSSNSYGRESHHEYFMWMTFSFSVSFSFRVKCVENINHMKLSSELAFFLFFLSNSKKHRRLILFLIETSLRVGQNLSCSWKHPPTPTTTRLWKIHKFFFSPFYFTLSGIQTRPPPHRAPRCDAIKQSRPPHSTFIFLIFISAVPFFSSSFIRFYPPSVRESTSNIRLERT